jgi:hypothetical protein
VLVREVQGGGGEDESERDRQEGDRASFNTYDVETRASTSVS